MTGELFLVLLIVAIAVAIFLASKRRRWTMPGILDRLKLNPGAAQRKLLETEQLFTESELQLVTAEQRSEAELERIQALIEGRKQIARDTDISYHLWSLYESHFRHTTQPSSDAHVHNGQWYDVKILKVSTANGLNTFEFELKGSRYKFVDDEEKKGWSEHVKLFSLFLYDESDRCLVEIPMKIRIDSLGRTYSILSTGPEAFLQGRWVSDFINVSLKQQSIRNQDIRAQKVQERLREIEELKDRFGISE